MANAKYDWAEAERVYCEGSVNDNGEREWKTLETVAFLFDIPEQRIRERARAEAWDEQRAAFKVHHEKVLQQKRQADLVKEATEFDTRALQAAKAGLQLVTLRTGEILRAAAERQKGQAEARARGEEFEDENFGVSPVDAKEVAALAQAAEGWQRVGSKALGEVETVRTEITGAGGAPLEVRQSVKAELTRDDSDRLYGVVVALQNAGLAMLPGGTGESAAIAPADEDEDEEAES